MTLIKRRKRFPGDVLSPTDIVDHQRNPAAVVHSILRGFHAPQREHVKHPMPIVTKGSDQGC